MQRILAAALFALFAFFSVIPANAQSFSLTILPSGCGTANYQSSLSYLTVDSTGKLCTAASVSASITGFQPSSTGTPISVTTGGVTGTLPAGAVVVASNVGATNGAYCKLGASATTSDQLIPPNSWFSFTVGASTQLTCITSTSTTTVNMVGGSGLPTGSGGGGGGSGGGGAITAAINSYAAGALSAGALASGAGTDGWDTTQGAKADAAWVSGSGSVVSILKNIAGGVAGAIPAGTALIGKVGIDQTTPGTTNGVQITAATAATPIAVAASDNHAVLKNGAGVAMSVHTSNNSATKNYLRLYDAGTGFNGCNSATGVIFAMEIPPTDGGFSISLGGGAGIAFTNGLSWCITSGFGLTDTTNATASAIYANASYR